jgi:hypothetical protein
MVGRRREIPHFGVNFEELLMSIRELIPFKIQLDHLRRESGLWFPYASCAHTLLLSTAHA